MVIHELLVGNIRAHRLYGHTLGLGMFWFYPERFLQFRSAFAPAGRFSKHWYLIKFVQIASSLGFGLLVYASGRIPVLYPISVGLLIAMPTHRLLLFSRI